MLPSQALGDEAFTRRVKIYATDVDDDALAHARYLGTAVSSTDVTEAHELQSCLREANAALAAAHEELRSTSEERGFTRQRDAEEALAAGFDAHIGKPVHAAELIEAVHEAASMRHR